MHPSSEIRPLTSLRFLAASLVVLEHLQMLPGLEWIGFRSNWPGIAGVRIFFVLSGFILSYTYWHRDWSTDFGRNAREFYGSRIARVFPLHWLMFFLALPLGLNSTSAPVSLQNTPLLLTLTDRLWPGTPIMAQPVKAAWTLSCEVLFYLCTPLIFFLLTRRRNPLFASGILFVSFTVVIVLIARITPHLNWSAYLEMPQFLLGIFGYHLYRRFDVSRHAGRLMIAGVALMLGAGSLGNLGFRPELLLAYAPGALLIILGAATLSPATAAGRFLSHRFMVLLGCSSYALYLLHDPAIRSVRVLLYRHEIVLSFPAAILTAVALPALLIGISIVLFRFYEDPARLRLRTLWSAKAERERAAAPPRETALP